MSQIVRLALVVAALLTSGVFADDQSNPFLPEPVPNPLPAPNSEQPSNALDGSSSVLSRIEDMIGEAELVVPPVEGPNEPVNATVQQEADQPEWYQPSLMPAQDAIPFVPLASPSEGAGTDSYPLVPSEVLPGIPAPIAVDAPHIVPGHVFPPHGSGGTPYPVALPRSTMPSQFALGYAAPDPIGPPAVLRVFCPKDTRLWINQRETTSRGAYRLLHVKGVTYGRHRSFTIRAESARVQIANPDRQLRLKSGDRITIRFESASEIGY